MSDEREATPPADGCDELAVEAEAGTTPPVDWLDELAVEAAAASRRAGHVARGRARATATWAGTLRDLAESGAEVVVRTTAATRHAGHLVAVADDHVLLRHGDAVTLIARAAVAAVHPGAGAPAATGDRPAPQDLTVGEVLFAWAEERAPALVVVAPEVVIAGHLVAVGEDVSSVATSAGPVHVPLEHVVAVTVR